MKQIVLLEEVADVVKGIVTGGSLCMDNMDDCRDMAQQFADKFNLKGRARDTFAKQAGFTNATDMDLPRDVDTE